MEVFDAYSLGRGQRGARAGSHRPRWGAEEVQACIAHSSRQSHGHTVRMSKQSDWDVRVTRVTNGWLTVLHAAS